MATNKSSQQGRSGNQGASKGGSQKQSGGASRKSTIKEDEKAGSSSGKGAMNK